MVEGGHHLRKAPNPHPHMLIQYGPETDKLGFNPCDHDLDRLLEHHSVNGNWFLKISWYDDRNIVKTVWRPGSFIEVLGRS